jgi:dUTP pyrophosphatase
MNFRLPVVRMHPEIPLPRYARAGDAGIDLHACCEVRIEPFERVLIPTGIKIALPDGYAGFVQPRSGHALKSGLTFVNTPGLIDSNYRGEIKVIAYNTDPTVPIEILFGEKIAQLVIQQVALVDLEEVAELDETNRGQAGFGSSGD